MSETSLFHDELLKFLFKNCQKQVEDEGIDPQADPKIQALLNGLSGASNALTLPEMIEQYHQLFGSKGLMSGSKGAIHLEKTLMEFFPVKDFLKLGLGRYYPRIYRGLPRLYNRDQPAYVCIKQNFTHLPTLKKQLLSKSLYSLYSKVAVKGKVTLFSWVINDGLGDFIAAVEVLRLLQARFPDVDLQFVALIPERILDHLTLPDPSIVIAYEKECPVEAISEKAIEVLRTSDLILQMPTYYPHTEKLLKKLGEVKMECIGEYGFIESPSFHPKSGNHSLGLHFLEKGVLTRKPFSANWADVQNEAIQAWRKEENHFYLAYLNSAIGGAIYLHALLKSLEHDPKGIDLCVPDLGWLLQFSERQEKAGRELLEWDLGIGQIEVTYQERLYVLKTAQQGKKLRIICPGIISQSDFRSLLALSGDWVAVRGNQSFSEAVSQNKAFFYDGRSHARYFIKDLAALAAGRLTQYRGALDCIRGIAQGFLYNLPLDESEWVEETFFQEIEDWTAIALKMGMALQDPETVAGYKKFNSVILHEFSANLFLTHLVQRALCHAHHPEIKAFEKEQVQRFSLREQSFAELICVLREKLGSV